MNFKKYMVAVLLVGIALFPYAATTGKISGRIIDKTTEQPLAGANIIVKGTSQGAAADIEGYYTILNVPPGTYTVSATYVGYAKVEQTDVIVKIDLNTKVDFDMAVEAFKGQEVVVTAQRPVVRTDISGSQTNISNDEINEMPVTSVSEAISLQAGVSGLEIRGGSSSELLYMVDGMSTNDQRSNTPYTSIPMSAVQEVQLQVGGFSAEYDNARSGVVSVVTKKGNKDKYTGTADIQYTPLQAKQFGTPLSDPNGYWHRAFLDEDICWTGSGNGVWDIYTKAQYRAFESGYNGLSEELMKDSDPTNDLTPAQLKEIYEYEHRRQVVHDDPDYIVDMGFGGPVPGGSALGNLRFYASYRGAQSAYIIPLSRDTYNDDAFRMNMSADLSPKTTLTVSGNWGKTQAVSTTGNNSPSTGGYYSSTWSVANLASLSYAMFQNGYNNPIDIERFGYGLELNHQFNERSFAKLIVNRTRTDYEVYPLDSLDLTDTLRLFEDIFGAYEYNMINEYPSGYHPSYSPGLVEGLRTDWAGFARDQSYNIVTTIKGDYQNQIARNNEIKTGFNFVHTRNVVDSWMVAPMTTWEEYYNWDQSPLRLGAYVLDKLEFEGLVVNAGLRFDMYNMNGEWYDLTPYDTLLNAVYGFGLDTLANYRKTKSVYSLNPRIGISHPISVNSKLYFNYGHFSSMPTATYLYIVDRYGDGGNIQRLGNPELPFSKTIMYELGYEHSFFDRYLAKIAAFYNDTKNQETWTSYIGLGSGKGKTNYSLAESRSYRDVSGFELTLKKMGTFVSGFVNYTYQLYSSGAFGIPNVKQEYETNPALLENDLKTNPVEYYPFPAPYARASLILKTPQGYSLGGLSPALTGGWTVSMLASWNDGGYSSRTAYSRVTLPQDNTIFYPFEWKDTWSCDLRASKVLSLNNFNVRIYLDIDNIFNIKNLSTTGSTGSIDWQDNYINSLHLFWEEGIFLGDDKIGDYNTYGEYVPIESYANLMTQVSQPLESVLYHNQADGVEKGESFYRWDGSEFVLQDQATVEELYSKKAYIDMPNLTSVTFLNPRTFRLGISVTF
ncbi:MAG: carboxypeptidase-like regulatory domain-containing protein [Candidatus Marinimicrobia bacterium]|nr:carboxypeptidase-like regulatory domain-containing protein [Candidatus Neomarinimicrobiota bacterium]